MDAELVIDQSEIDFVREGQVVEIMVDALPGDTFETTIGYLSPEKLRNVSPQLSSRAYGDVETITDETGAERPISTSFQALARMDNLEGVVRPGMRGRAKIHAGYQTLGQRFWRYITQTFNFKL
jgi:putative peptide zinc metalloprotease protein